MSSLQIAKKEITDAVRRRIAYFLIVLFGLTGLVIGYIEPDGATELMVHALSGLGPFVAVAYVGPSLTNKRKNDEVATLLSLPVSRHEIVVGSYLGKTAILATAIVCSYVWAACGAFLADGTVLALDHLVWLLLSTLLITAVFVGIGLGFAVAINSTVLATSCAFLTYLLLALQVWAFLPLIVLYFANGLSIPETSPTWVHIFHQLSPYATLRNLLVPVAGDVADNIFVFEEGDAENISFYKSAIVAVPATFIWLTAPLLLGYHRFRKGGL